ncbi:MAG: DoxX family protein [Campylobacterales bacterium]|nr:DoxX family protein [Campylobacterales bacterium]
MGVIEKKLAVLLSADLGKLVLRVAIAVLMLFHGFKKISSGITGIKALVVKGGFPEILAYGVYVGELVVPILLILGLFTRLSAFFFAATMGFVLTLAFSGRMFALDGRTGGLVAELPLLYLLCALAVFFLGAGKYSLDNKLGQA